MVGNDVKGIVVVGVGVSLEVVVVVVVERPNYIKVKTWGNREERGERRKERKEEGREIK